MRSMEKMAEIFLDDLECDLGILSETMAIQYDLRMFLKGYEKMPFFGRDRIIGFASGHREIRDCF